MHSGKRKKNQATVFLRTYENAPFASAFMLPWQAPKREEFMESGTTGVYPTALE
jgi:hypothetical protein